jgi:hypothetical protein
VAVATTITTTTLTSRQAHPPIAATSQNDENSAQSETVSTNSRNVRRRTDEQQNDENSAQSEAVSTNSRNVRRRTDDIARFDALQLLLTALFERFNAIELGNAGNCLFSVLLYLQNHGVPHANLASAGAAVDEDHALTRSRIANHLEARTATTSTLRLYEPSGCDVYDGMIDEHGSRQAYLDWIRMNGSPGGFIEVVAWVDLFKVHIKLISSTMIEGTLLEEPVNAIGASDDAPTFHIFHQVGRGGVGGHYQYLQPILLPRQQTCEPPIATNGNAVTNLAPNSPSS